MRLAWYVSKLFHLSKDGRGVAPPGRPSEAATDLFSDHGAYNDLQCVDLG